MKNKLTETLPQIRCTAETRRSFDEMSIKENRSISKILQILTENTSKRFIESLKDKMVVDENQMSEKEAIILLAYFNDWRLGNDIEMPDPIEITKALRLVVEKFKERHYNQK